MPVLVDLLLLDDDPQAPAHPGTSQVATAKGLYAELQRQLQEPNSHLKRKSALGALIGRGAAARYVGCEAPPPASSAGAHLLGDTAPAPAPAAEHHAQPGHGGAGTAAALHGAAAAQDGAAAAPDGGSSCSGGRSSTSRPGEGQGLSRVPRILDFPQSRSRPSMIPLGGMDLVTSLFGWLPSCAPATCKSLQPSQVDSCTIVVAPPEAHGSCVPMPVKISAAKEDPSGKFEAGLGGWPLCVPHACVAFQQAAHPGAAVAPDAFAGSPAPGPRFRKAAIEVDDAELAVILAPTSPGQQSCNSPGMAQTPSTASTTDTLLSRAPSFPGAAGYSRVILSREDTASVKRWPELGTAFCNSPQYQAPTDGDAVYPHVVEVCGTPAGTPQPLTVLLALPSGSLATRLHDALSSSRRRARRASTRGGPEAVRCELQLEARLALHSAASEQNCAAVIRRGICEACHVGSERVRICCFREATTLRGSFSGEAVGRAPEASPSEPGGPVADGAECRRPTPEEASPLEAAATCGTAACEEKMPTPAEMPAPEGRPNVDP